MQKKQPDNIRAADSHIQIYLASSSPRRRELLTQMGVSFSLVFQDVEEFPQPNESPHDFVLRLAQQKATAGFEYCKQSSMEVKPVLGSDTAIVIDGRIMGKPENKQQGIEMLMLLSNRTHQVMSAVAIKNEKLLKTALSISQVTFTTLSPAICEQYWHTGEPADKAGSYAIQGKGAIFIKELKGSYSGVMGLPIYETARLLKFFDIHIF